MLTPELIAQSYTEAQINAKIEQYQTALDNAIGAKKLVFDSGQGEQEVTYQDIAQIQEQLALWMEAKMIKTGGTVSGARFITLEYN